ncbi:MAG TPA: hypothetical protein VE913_06500 [Longimicrobium sp.]|nr:hypothetical protein [Longimicrobium sp.]
MNELTRFATSVLPSINFLIAVLCGGEQGPFALRLAHSLAQVLPFVLLVSAIVLAAVVANVRDARRRRARRAAAAGPDSTPGVPASSSAVGGEARP